MNLLPSSNIGITTITKVLSTLLKLVGIFELGYLIQMQMVPFRRALLWKWMEVWKEWSKDQKRKSRTDGGNDKIFIRVRVKNQIIRMICSDFDLYLLNLFRFKLMIGLIVTIAIQGLIAESVFL